jgi:hypothetical protein
MKSNDLLTFITEFSDCKSQLLKDSYLASINNELITTKNSPIALQRLLKFSHMLSFNKKDTTLVQHLIMLTFSKMEQPPTFEEMKKRLFEDPTIENLWYMILEKYELFK